MKRYGQLSQFTFILGVVIILVVIFAGYRVISGFQDRAENLAEDATLREIVSDINKIKGKHGSFTVNDYSLPHGINTVCFVDTKNVEPEQIGDAVIRASVENGAYDNVFLIKPDGMQTEYVSNLRVEPPYFYCTNESLISIMLVAEKSDVIIQVPLGYGIPTGLAIINDLEAEFQLEDLDLGIFSMW